MLLKGIPLIGYTIKAALKSKYITKVIVSTDCKEIYEIAVRLGAESSFLRPPELAMDTSLAIDNYIYTIDRLEKDMNSEIESFIVLQPTSPFRDAIHIDEAIDIFINKKADSVISFTEEEHPIFWNKYVDCKGKVTSIFDNEKLDNRQNYSKTYSPNGAIYIFKKHLINSRLYYSDKTFGYIMDRGVSIDIDTKEDFEFAEFKMERRCEGNNNFN